MPMIDKYTFTGDVREATEKFKTYLKAKQLNENTIRQKTNYAGYFLQWLEEKGLHPVNVRYNDLLSFIDYCRQEGDAQSGAHAKSKKQTNRIITSVRDYYRFLKTIHPDITNPAATLYLRGEKKSVLKDTIEYKELESLYQSFENSGTIGNRSKRNKIILGLLVYQGVTTQELKQLEPGHVKLKEGKIYIPGNKRSNHREIELKPFQILDLHEYLSQIRPEILNETTKPRPSRKPRRINKTQIEKQLFSSINGSENIKSTLLHLFKEVQKINPGITNAKQIRQSTITYWLKTIPLRQVQYMAGHKHVSSTERYQLNNLDNLKDKIERCHPLNNAK